MYVVTWRTKAIDLLPPIAHVFWVHGQGLICMGHNQYIKILFIQASEYPSCGTRFGKNYKTTKPSSGLSMLLSEEWMCWHQFHMFCGCMGRVWQAWDIINTLWGSCTSKSQSTPDFGPWWLCQNLIYLGWLKLCGAIDIVQCHCDGVETSIWDLYQVCYNTKE